MLWLSVRKVTHVQFLVLNQCARAGNCRAFSGSVEAAFWFVAISMFLSGTILWLLGEKTHPRINPKSSGDHT
jgi:hypothetical protein